MIGPGPQGGTSGVSGSSGYSGYSGAGGGAGTSGVSGTSGFSGAAGSAGASGTSGTSGTSGKSGTSGVSGASGVSGTGTSGTSGASGTAPTSKAPLGMIGAGQGLATLNGQVFSAPSDPGIASGGAATDEATVSFVVPYAGTIHNLIIRTASNAAIGGTTVTVVVRKNEANTTLTATMSASELTTTSDTTHSFSVSQLDRITFSLTPVGGTLSAGIASITVEFDSP